MSTNQKWEPLETASAAFRALSQGRVVEAGMPGVGWDRTTCLTVDEFKAAMSGGLKYRARIEGSEP